MRKTHRFVQAVAVAVASLGIAKLPAALAAPGEIFSLGTLPGGSQSYGSAINASGQVAGASYGGVIHAFRYTGTPCSGGAMADLGTLGGSISEGFGINASGQVAGSSDTTGDVFQRAFRYTGTPGSGGVMVDLGTLGGAYSQGFAINDSGQVTGDAYTPVSGASHAYRWTSGGTGGPASNPQMADLGTLGGTSSTGFAINAFGQVAGSSARTVGSGVEHAFRYTGTPGSGGAMVDLGTLGGTAAAAWPSTTPGRSRGTALRRPVPLTHFAGHLRARVVQRATPRWPTWAPSVGRTAAAGPSTPPGRSWEAAPRRGTARRMRSSTPARRG